jgi:hypothetical protein
MSDVEGEEALAEALRAQKGRGRAQKGRGRKPESLIKVDPPIPTPLPPAPSAPLRELPSLFRSKSKIPDAKLYHHAAPPRENLHLLPLFGAQARNPESGASLPRPPRRPGSPRSTRSRGQLRIRAPNTVSGPRGPAGEWTRAPDRRPESVHPCPCPCRWALADEWHCGRARSAPAAHSLCSGLVAEIAEESGAPSGPRRPGTGARRRTRPGSTGTPRR